jgi:beta-galactosidase
VEHALKHARKHNLQLGHPQVTGAIGWCAFDYHTHQEFGSGDRICHHGVMDMYRLPKMAAYFYRSQKSPEDEIVLYPATNWTIGDRSGGGNNPLVVFSNCESVEVLMGGELQGRFYPDTEQYPHLPHPPFTIVWPEPYNPWGTQSRELEVRGYIGEKCVATHRIASDHLPERLHVWSNTDELAADGADMARIAVQVVDKYGNVLPYQSVIVHWSIVGDAAVIGENPVVLLGGQVACFVKSSQSPGEVTITASSDGFEPVSLQLKVVDVRVP